MAVRIKVRVPDSKIILRDPHTKLPITDDAKGTSVKKNSFWIRRLKRGECILVDDMESGEAMPVQKTPKNKPDAKRGNK